MHAQIAADKGSLSRSSDVKQKRVAAAKRAFSHRPKAGSSVNSSVAQLIAGVTKDADGMSEELKHRPSSSAASEQQGHQAVRQNAPVLAEATSTATVAVHSTADSGSKPPATPRSARASRPFSYGPKLQTVTGGPGSTSAYGIDANGSAASTRTVHAAPAWEEPGANARPAAAAARRPFAYGPRGVFLNTYSIAAPANHGGLAAAPVQDQVPITYKYSAHCTFCQQNVLERA